jgi:hypothetical protein
MLSVHAAADDHPAGADAAVPLVHRLALRWGAHLHHAEFLRARSGACERSAGLCVRTALHRSASPLHLYASLTRRARSAAPTHTAHRWQQVSALPAAGCCAIFPFSPLGLPIEFLPPMCCARACGGLDALMRLGGAHLLLPAFVQLSSRIESPRPCAAALLPHASPPFGKRREERRWGLLQQGRHTPHAAASRRVRACAVPRRAWQRHAARVRRARAAAAAAADPSPCRAGTCAAAHGGALLLKEVRAARARHACVRARPHGERTTLPARRHAAPAHAAAAASTRPSSRCTHRVVMSLCCPDLAPAPRAARRRGAARRRRPYEP